MINIEWSDAEASDWRPRHEHHCHEACFLAACLRNGFDDWFDPIEAGVRDRVREFIQAMGECELGSALMRPRYGRRPKSLSDAPAAGVTGHRHGHRPRSLTGTFGRIEIEVPRARLDGPDGKRTEWKSKTVRAISAAPLQLTH